MDYDPLISKLAAWGATRDEAIARMKRALGEYHIEGIQTNIPFFRDVLDHADFRRGDFDTGFIDRWLKTRTSPPPLSTVDQDFAILAAGLFQSQRPETPPAAGNREEESLWKRDGRRRGLRS